MNLSHEINERDLFNFVFFSHLLEDEKKIYLNENEEKFGQIRFYEKLKENLMLSVDNNIKEKLAERISAYKKSTQVIHLFPIEINIERKPQEMPIFAAASATEEPKVIAKSFIDEDKTFVVRMLKMENKTKIYPFALLSNDVQKLKITLYPSEQSYTIESDQHLEMDLIEEIESVSVEEVN